MKAWAVAVALVGVFILGIFSGAESVGAEVVNSIERGSPTDAVGVVVFNEPLQNEMCPVAAGAICVPNKPAGYVALSLNPHSPDDFGTLAAQDVKIQADSTG